MGFGMWFQMQLNPPPPDPVQRRMFQLMPIFFTFLLANFAAGLVIYWAWNNFLSIIQQTVIMKRMGTYENPLGRIKLPRAVRDRLPSLPRLRPAAATAATAAPASEGASDDDEATDPFLGEEGEVRTVDDEDSAPKKEGD